MDDEKQLNQFRNQITEDIELIQKKFKKHDTRLRVNNYAFNFWILSNIYDLDESVICSQIIDRNDKAIDCYVHYPESKILYLIQNKYYDEKTPVQREELVDFLYTPLDFLAANNYKRSSELQNLFNQIKDDKEYKYFLHFYVSNTRSSLPLKTSLQQFQLNPKHKFGEIIVAEYFTLCDLYDKYYGLQYKDRVNFKYTLKTKVAKNILNILPEDYKMPTMSKAFYMLTPVWQIWEMLKDAKAKKYPLFEENIREYLGLNDINGRIIKTLKDENERNNFFYYNNGVTFTCESIPRDTASLTLVQPQIINGCQTVNSIFHCLENFGSKENIENEFKDVYVMCKILLFDETTRKKKGDEFYNRIVKFNNKQNPLNEKAFASKTAFFDKIRTSFKDYGFLLLVKPSDKFQYKNQISELEINNFLDQANAIASKFGLTLRSKKDLHIQLEKLLQVYIAFVTDGHNAFTKKGNLLKENSEFYKNYSLKINQLTTLSLVILWVIYLRAEMEKDESEDQITPIPYYVIGFLGYLINNPDKRNDVLQSLIEGSHKNFEGLYNYLTKLTTEYKLAYAKKYPVKGYNNMIKDKIDEAVLKEQIDLLNRLYASKETKAFLDNIASV